jgi:uncharacterized protein (TIGR03437 family)
MRNLCLALLFALGSQSRAASPVYVATDQGLLKSVDAAATWSKVNISVSGGLLTGSALPRSIAVDPTDASKIYLTGLAGVSAFFSSPDAGQTWTAPPITGFRPLEPGPFHLSVDLAGQTVYVIGFSNNCLIDCAIYKSNNKGASWSRVSLPNTTLNPVAQYPLGSPAYIVSADPTLSGTVWASNGFTLFKSFDFGDTWAPISTGFGLGTTAILGIVSDPFNPSTWFALNSIPLNGVPCPLKNGGQCGIFKSSDAGATWTGLNFPAGNVYSLSPAQTSGLLYATADVPGLGGALLRSQDGGVNWSPLKAGLTSGGAARPQVRSDMADASLPYVLDQGGSRSIFTSKDGGASFSQSQINYAGCPSNCITLQSFDIAIGAPAPRSQTAGSSTVTLQVNTRLNLDAGAIATSAGDLLWTGTSLNPQGRATAYVLSDRLGQQLFEIYTDASLAGFKRLSSAAPIPASSLPADSLLAVFTNGAIIAKVLVTANSGGSLTLKYQTYGTPLAPDTPLIQSISDAAANAAGIAQGSIFVVKGINLCPSGSALGSVPYSQEPLSDAKITFIPVTGGDAKDAYMVSTYADAATSQLTGILPSTVATGDYNVTVTRNGKTSTPLKATVMTRKFGIMTVSGTGLSRAVVQNYISETAYGLNRFTTGSLGDTAYSPAHPGQVVAIQGTGLGPIAGPDNEAPGSEDMLGNLDIKVLFNGIPVVPDLYAGRVPYLPGADQIILTVPSNVTTGCAVPLQVVVNDQPSNQTTISIAPIGETSCIFAPLTTDRLAALDQGGLATVGALSIGAGVSGALRLDSASYEFYTLDADGVAGLIQTPIPPELAVPAESCVVSRSMYVYPLSPVEIPKTSIQVSDPGKIVLNGPNASNVTISPITTLSANLPGVTAVQGAVITAGKYTFSGMGGADVGPFQASIDIDPPLIPTAPSSPVLRNQGLTLNWTGGGTTPLTISGAASVLVSGSGGPGTVVDSGTFRCVTTGDKKTFSIPSSVLEQLPPANSATLIVSGSNLAVPFTAPLTNGGSIDVGTLLSSASAFFSVTLR